MASGQVAAVGDSDAALLAELDDLFRPGGSVGDRYALAAQREVDTEKYAFEAV